MFPTCSIDLGHLTQPVHVGLKRVGDDTRAVAPDFLKQDVPPDHVEAAAVEVFEDRGFRLGQADLVLGLAVDQHLGGLQTRQGINDPNEFLVCPSRSITPLLRLWGHCKVIRSDWSAWSRLTTS